MQKSWLASTLVSVVCVACAVGAGGLLQGCASSAPARSAEPVVRPSTALIGQPMPSLAGTEQVNPAQPAGAPPVVGRVTVVELGATDCPVCVRVAPELDALAERYPAGRVAVVRVVDGRAERVEDVRRHAKEAQVPSPVLYDATGRLFDACEVSRYPSVFVLDPAGRVVWWQATARVELVEEWVTDTVYRAFGELPQDVGTH
jgi:thiol-disulfide isomerase/thioredoxin